jgi:hypothetical protein
VSIPNLEMQAVDAAREQYCKEVKAFDLLVGELPWSWV